MATQEKIGTDLFHRTMEWADSQADDPLERGELMRKVWRGTPWMVNAYTDSISNHGRYREIMDWCHENFGRMAHPIADRPGNWQTGNATVHGYTWVGFATEEMMDKFWQQWGEVPEEEIINARD